jgi:hypothetical protein
MRLGPDGRRGSAKPSKFVDVVPKLIQAVQLMPAFARKSTLRFRRLLLLALSGRQRARNRGPLLGVKRTSR